jgi:trk system potassium uptake protein TrkA
MGSGIVGLNLASFLISDGHDVTLIESDESLSSNAASQLDALVIFGNGTNTKTLKEANIMNADVFVAATEHDESNLLACVLVKEYNIPKIISRVSDPSHAAAFKKIGVNSVISPELTAASYLEKLIIRPKTADLVVLGRGDAELLDFTVDYEKTIGKKVSDLSPTDDFIIVAIHEKGKIIIPQPDMILKEGMKISVLVKTKFAKKVRKRFTKL